MKITPVTEVPQEDTTPQVRKTRSVVMPPAIAAAVDFAPTFVPQEIPVEYSIEYFPLCGDRVKDTPSLLHYKPIDGFVMMKINELNEKTFDVGINQVLNSLCYESKVSTFNHWSMNTNEKVRAYLNLRINSESEFIETAFGFCTTCMKHQPFINLNITGFEEIELSENYKEPFKLKITGSDKKIIKFQVRMLQTGDSFYSVSRYDKDKVFVNTYFPGNTDEDKDQIIQIMEYANSILSIEGNLSPTFEEKVTFCKKNLNAIKAITTFNDNFGYGMDLKTRAICYNTECPTHSFPEKDPRGSLFRIPIQPALFYILGEGKADQYFDDDL